MNREVIATGKTVEEAIEKAREKLAAPAEETSFEILELPRRGFLGLRHSPAKVRVYVLADEEAAAHTKQPREDGRGQRPEVSRGAARENAAPIRQETVRKENQADKAQKQKPAEPAAEPAKTAWRPAERAAGDRHEKEDTGIIADLQPGDVSPKAVVAWQYVRDVLAAMGVRDAQVTVREDSENIEIMLEGGDLGVVIGRRGETLDAVQYLTSLVANRTDGTYIRVLIDSGDYRKKRAETLERLAVKLARSAVKTGRSTKLEAMNPYERRIIHAAVSRVDGATSSSIGEEPNRRVVISAKGARRKPDSIRENAGRSSARPPRKYPERTERVAHVDDLAARPAPPAKLRDADIEIPRELAPKELPEVHPASKAVPEAKIQTDEEKSALPLYGKLDV